MPTKNKRTRAGRTKLSRPAKTVEKQLEDLSDVSMCSMISEGQNTKEEMLAVFLQEFDNGGMLNCIVWLGLIGDSAQTKSALLAVIHS